MTEYFSIPPPHFYIIHKKTTIATVKTEKQKCFNQNIFALIFTNTIRKCWISQFRCRISKH